jgi:hypothetical protein
MGHCNTAKLTSLLSAYCFFPFFSFLDVSTLNPRHVPTSFMKVKKVDNKIIIGAASDMA